MQFHKILRELVEISTPHLKAIERADFQAKPRPEKWSKQEILGHLQDSAYNNHQRFLRAPLQGNLIFQGYDQNEWVSRNRYQHRSKEEVIESWRMSNLHMASMLESLSDEELKRQTTDHNYHQISSNRISEGEPATLGHMIWDYLAHFEYHMAQIIPNFQPILPPFEAVHKSP